MIDTKDKKLAKQWVHSNRARRKCNMKNQVQCHLKRKKLSQNLNTLIRRPLHKKIRL